MIVVKKTCYFVATDHSNNEYKISSTEVES